MIDLTALPDFYIMHGDSIERLALSACGKQIRWLSEQISQHFQEKRCIGLIFPTSKALILHWLAVLDSGREPIILQCPAKQQGGRYWYNSLSHILQSADIHGLVCTEDVQSAGVETLTRTMLFTGQMQEASTACEQIEAGAFIQLSSGTTGSGKAIRFTLDEAWHKVQNYNKILGMKQQDCRVTCVPLCHVTGLLNSLLFPLFLKVPVVMIDPITWINDYNKLFEAIQRFNCTVCTMPNFGFEAMARVAITQPLTTIRQWISGGEPSSYDTILRFCHNIKADPSIISTVYGMAENLGAISLSKGLRTCERNGKIFVSCGRPIPGTQVKLVDDEFFFKSGNSLNYINHSVQMDAEGYFATGDIGFIENGEIYVQGRKRDVMVQAGRKFLLNELDSLLGQIVPGCHGKGICLANYDKRIGTQILMIILEQENITDKDEQRKIIDNLTKALPVQTFKIHFVPQGFITKTSSGKLNRLKTMEDFQKMERWAATSNRAQDQDIEQEISSHFHGVSYDAPISETIDSLGFILIEAITRTYNIDISSTMSLSEIIQICKNTEKKQKQSLSMPQDKVISIVSLMDYQSTGLLTAEDLERIARSLGAPVHFEHVCMPPAPVILHDLLFCDYFLCRDFDERYENYLNCVRKIKEASVLLFDDITEYQIGSLSVFPLMNKNFQRNTFCDLIAYRWQNYARQHQLLPLGDIIHGSEYSPARHELALQQITSYLDIPIFRVAFYKIYQQYTTNWEYRDYIFHSPYTQGNVMTCEQHDKLVSALIEYLLLNKSRLKIKDVGSATLFPIYKDDSHFCSVCINPLIIEKIVKYFNSFIIHGLPNSVPYLERRIRAEGKKFCYMYSIQDLNEERGKRLAQEYECILQTGGWGTTDIPLPVISLMYSGGPFRMNMPDSLQISPEDFIILPKDMMKHLFQTVFNGIH